jgi:hypothetical protein
MNHLLTQFIEQFLSEGNQDVQEGPKLIDQVVSTTLPENNESLYDCSTSHSAD